MTESASTELREGQREIRAEVAGVRTATERLVAIEETKEEGRAEERKAAIEERKATRKGRRKLAGIAMAGLVAMGGSLATAAVSRMGEADGEAAVRIAPEPMPPTAEALDTGDE